MEIVSSRNHRYTPDSERGRKRERERTLSALIDSSVPRGKVRGTSVLAIGLGRYASFFSPPISLLPPLHSNIVSAKRSFPTLPFDSPMRLAAVTSLGAKMSGPPTTIHRCIFLRSTRSTIPECRFTLLPQWRWIDENSSVYLDSNIVILILNKNGFIYFLKASNVQYFVKM